MPTIMQSRMKTGIEGLDDLLNGGLVNNRLYLIEGDPGTGKTTLALQFLMEGIRLGEKVLYITLSETVEELQSVAESHGWNLDGMSMFELNNTEGSLEPEQEITLFHPWEVELGETVQRITKQIERINPTRIAFDSLSELRLLAQDPLRYRRQILSFKQFFAGRNCTVLMLDDHTGNHGQSDQQLQSIAHGVISLNRVTVEYGVARRRLEIQKYRGSQFRGGWNDYIIRKGGLDVFPRLVASEHHMAFESDLMLSGIPAMDNLLGGGILRGSSTLLTGPGRVRQNNSGPPIRHNPGPSKGTMSSCTNLTNASRRCWSGATNWDKTSNSMSTADVLPSARLIRPNSHPVNFPPLCAKRLKKTRSSY